MASSSTTRTGAAAQQRTVPGQRSQEEEEGRAPSAARVPVIRTTGAGIRLPGGITGNMLWWGSLAALAALEIVEWPVAALLAAGTWIAEQHAKQTKRTEVAR